MLEFLTSFFIAVLGGVACHYIIKWLDGDDKGNNQPSGCFATIKEKKNPPTVLPYGRGIHFFVNVDFLHLFAYRHYSICRNLFQYTLKIYQGCFTKAVTFHGVGKKLNYYFIHCGFSDLITVFLCSELVELYLLFATTLLTI